jgi:hypothetical protein
MNWLNSKRLRDYPRLILISYSIVLFLNIVLSNGWIGGIFGLLMWGDYIDYYAAGIIYKDNISQLYNPAVQESTQRALLYPTNPPGVTFYSYPPNAAQAHSLLSYIPLPTSVILWCITSVICIIFAAMLMKKYLLPDRLTGSGLSTLQLSIIVLSSFAFVEGFATGQMHSITLLLMVGVLIATIKEKWFLAGLLAAGLTYKPQFVVGFLLLWLIWKKYYAILVFILFTAIWNGIVLVTKGIGPYLAFLDFTKNMVYLPYVDEGFPTAILSTPYSLIASILPIQFSSLWSQLYLVITVMLIIGFGWLAYKLRSLPVNHQNIALSMAMLLPLLISPYVLLHDLLIIMPIFILLAVRPDQDRKALNFAIIVYLAMLIIPPVGIPLNIALAGLIPVIVLIYWGQQSLQLLRA